MTIVPVSASKKYDVIIGEKLIREAGNYISQVQSNCVAAIISDSNVWPCYGAVLEKSLQQAGFHTCAYIFPAGEASKTAQTYLSILNFLAENRITRSDIMIALGGGVVGDITGFAAATYLRGIPYVQIPTSLLAMVDSSVGGKTAIDLPAGKNLAGAFYQPWLVLCDINALDTLPEEVFRDGCAEVIKYGILYDEALFEHLHKKGLAFAKEDVISRCVALKRDVVAQDEFDTGARQRLNLGHTIGHGIEAGSQFAVSHGRAVAIGMAIAAKAAATGGICSQDTKDRIWQVLETFGLPTNTDLCVKELYTYALSDKKRFGNTINLIVPERIGSCLIYPVCINDLEEFLASGF